MSLTGAYKRIAPQGGDASGIDRDEARAGAIHILSLTASKVADGLADPKLVLAWLLNAVGSPGAFVGALVPVREAGALLPQLGLAARAERVRRLKTFWATGALVEGAAALGIAAAAVLLSGWAAGAAVVALLAVLSVARAACSVSHKDILAKTVAKTRRGSVSGFAASAASSVVLLFGLLLATGLLPLTVATVAGAVALAGLLWLIAGGVLSLLDEPASEAQGSGRSDAGSFLEPLREDVQLRRFIATRALLTVTALAVPFIVMLTGEGGDALGALGPLVLASAAASIVAGYVWGRLSDLSSRQTLMRAGALGAVVYAVIAGTGLAWGTLGPLSGAAAVFFAQIAYEGVRQGRKIHLTDMAGTENRARYTAVSNSVIGVVLLVGGLFGLVADWLGPAAVIGLFAIAAAAAVPLARTLDEVQATAD